MKQNFDTCLKHVLKHEGGYANHPKDPGGSTFRGVTQRTYDDYRRQRNRKRKDVREISDSELKHLYRVGYWDKVNGDNLASGVDCFTFDSAVNSGPGRARQWLRKAIGGSDLNTIRKMADIRMSFLRRLGHWNTFKRGWTRRVNECEAFSVRLAGGKVALERGSRAAKDRARKATNGALASGTGGAGGTAAVETSATGSAILFLVIVIAVGAVVYFIRKRMKERKRSKAYEREMVSVQQDDAGLDGDSALRDSKGSGHRSRIRGKRRQ